MEFYFKIGFSLITLLFITSFIFLFVLDNDKVSFFLLGLTPITGLVMLTLWMWLL